MAGYSDLIDQIYKNCGQPETIQTVSGWLDTGFLPLNKILSGSYQGGFPEGRITEISGMESSGKTLLATIAMISSQQKNGLAIFNDHEYSFDVEFAKTRGLLVDPEHWIYWQPETAEDSFGKFNFVCDLIMKEKKPRPVTIVVDSIASMMTKEELEAGMDSNMKVKLSLASFLSSGAGLKQAAAKVNKSNATLILLNQLRVNPTIQYGDKSTRPGGNAPRFYASARIDLRKTGLAKDGEEVIGEKVTAKCIKNKVGGLTHHTCDWVTRHGEGINLPLSHIEALESMGIMGNTKGWLEFAGKKWRKKELSEKAREDADLYNKLLAMFKD